MTYITSKEEIREVIGSPPKSVYLKKIAKLEKHSKRYLQMSHLIVISAKSIPNRIHLMATQQCTMVIASDTKITLTIKDNSEAAVSVQDEPCGLYVLVAGFEESLRINGKVCFSSERDGNCVIEIDIEELYFHCAKSIKRSRFWTSMNYAFSMDRPLEETDCIDSDITDFIHKSPFLLLATQNQQGEADLSPRGDPGGFVRVLDSQTVLIPERPGNKIADSMRNIVADSSMAVILLVPGTQHCLVLTGNGKLTTSQAVLKTSEINNKVPKIGIELAVTKIYFGITPALADQDLWDASGFADRSELPSLGMMVSEQLQSSGKLPGGDSVVGRMFGKAIGAASEIAIKQDYKKNMY